jgi:hypothetical protein
MTGWRPDSPKTTFAPMKRSAREDEAEEMVSGVVAPGSSENERRRLDHRGRPLERCCASVRVEGDLAAEVDALLERAALNAVSLARKAGEVVSGFAKVEAALRGSDPVIGLIQASDGGDDGTGKLAAIARARFADAGGCRIVRTFESTQLDLALGRSNVIHAALLAGRAAKNALDRIADLERFRAGFNEASHGGVSDAVIQD